MMCRGERAENIVRLLEDIIYGKHPAIYTRYMKRKIDKSTLLRTEIDIMKNIRKELVICGYTRNASKIDALINIAVDLLRIDSKTLTDELIHEFLVLVDRVLSACVEDVRRVGVYAYSRRANL